MSRRLRSNTPRIAAVTAIAAVASAFGIHISADAQTGGLSPATVSIYRANWAEPERFDIVRTRTEAMYQVDFGSNPLRGGELVEVTGEIQHTPENTAHAFLTTGIDFRNTSGGAQQITGYNGAQCKNGGKPCIVTKVGAAKVPPGEWRYVTFSAVGEDDVDGIEIDRQDGEMDVTRYSPAGGS